MTWEQRRGLLRQLGGRLKVGWARLTGDDLLLLEGTKDVFVGKLLARSGPARQAAEEQLDALLRRISELKRAGSSPGRSSDAQREPLGGAAQPI